MAPARGCSLPRSRLAASAQHSVLGPSRQGLKAARRGLPSVSVPVLSTSKRVHFAENLQGLGVADQHAWLAPRPVPTMIDMGVASPKAQGQAMISTATALTRA